MICDDITISCTELIENTIEDIQLLKEKILDVQDKMFIELISSGYTSNNEVKSLIDSAAKLHSEIEGLAMLIKK